MNESQQNFAIKLQTVKTWLQKVYKGGPNGTSRPIPSFEATPNNIDKLCQLALEYEVQQNQLQLLIEDCKFHRQFCSMEAQRIKTLLSRLGIKKENLSSSCKNDIDSLSDVAVNLNIDNVSLASYMAGLLHFRNEREKLNSTLSLHSKKLQQLRDATRESVTKLNALKKVKQQLDDEFENKNTTPEENEKEIQFIKAKQEYYNTAISNLQREITTSGLHSDLTHRSLCDLAQHLHQLKQKVEPARRMLQSYHQLPPDISLATTKVEEARLKLKELKDKFSSQCSLMNSN